MLSVVVASGRLLKASSSMIWLEFFETIRKGVVAYHMVFSSSPHGWGLLYLSTLV